MTDPLEALASYIEWFGALHEDDCPEDDTCDCSFKALNAGVNEAYRRLAALPAIEQERDALRANEGLLLERLSTALTGGNAATWDEVCHAADALSTRIAACAPFLKDGETPAECIARNRADLDALMGLLATCRTHADEREKALRAEWWNNHGCDPAARYGDDGEMQCSHQSHGPMDFKRMPFDELNRAVFTLRMRRVQAAFVEYQAKQDLDALRTQHQALLDRLAGLEREWRAGAHVSSSTVRADAFTVCADALATVRKEQG